MLSMSAFSDSHHDPLDACANRVADAVPSFNGWTWIAGFVITPSQTRRLTESKVHAMPGCAASYRLRLSQYADIFISVVGFTSVLRSTDQPAGTLNEAVPAQPRFSDTNGSVMADRAAAEGCGAFGVAITFDCEHPVTAIPTTRSDTSRFGVRKAGSFGSGEILLSRGEGGGGLNARGFPRPEQGVCSPAGAPVLGLTG